MNVQNRKYLKAALVVMIICSVQFASAQSGGEFTIIKSTIDAGGGESQGGEFKINGTIGQADASAKISGGEFSLTGGYWTASNDDDLIFKNGFEAL